MKLGHIILAYFLFINLVAFLLMGIDKKKAKTNSKKKKNNDKPRRNYGKEVVSELKKVNWPSFKKTCKQTGTVLVVVGVFMLAVFGIDSLVAWILKLITKI